MTSRRISARNEITDAAAGVVAVLGVIGATVAVIRWPIVGVLLIGVVIGVVVGLQLRSTWLRRVLEAKGWLDEEVESLKQANYQAVAKVDQLSGEHGAVGR